MLSPIIGAWGWSAALCSLLWLAGFNRYGLRCGRPLPTLCAAGALACAFASGWSWKLALAAAAAWWHGARIRCVGLTGGIAVGKSLAAAELRRCGAVVIDADDVARVVVAPNSPGLRKLVEAFNREQILAVDGSLDRAKVRALVFSDAQARKRLNAITHPAIALEIIKLVAVERWMMGRTVVIDAALLHESGWFLRLLCSPVLCVTADHGTQVARVMARDATTAAEAEAVIAAQAPQRWKAARSDVVLANDGDAGTLCQQVRALWPRL